MPSASVTEDSVIAPDSECSGCGNPIIIDGQFKCLRCRPKRLVPATLDKRDIVCPRHDPSVVLMRYDRKSGQYRAYCQKSGCPNRKAKIGTPVLVEEQKMEQRADTQEEVQPPKIINNPTIKEKNPEVPSKTQELRDWLDAEIKRCSGDARILEHELNLPKGYSFGLALASGATRYAGLTSEECETKMKGDRTKLEELKERLELLRSARELDVDVDALERSVFGLHASLRLSQSANEHFAVVISVPMAFSNPSDSEKAMDLHRTIRFSILPGKREVILSSGAGELFLYGLEKIEILKFSGENPLDSRIRFSFCRGEQVLRVRKGHFELYTGKAAISSS